ncbi:hypothetical protein H6783_01530 [Candidatus Nomurabacteria bacterium]|nr:hypothetical protein [Candidatus Nomurabacteria bacterium]
MNRRPIIIAVIAICVLGLVAAVSFSQPGDFLYKLKSGFADSVSQDPTTAIADSMSAVESEMKQLKKMSLENQTVDATAAEEIAGRVSGNIDTIITNVRQSADTMTTEERVNTYQTLDSYLFAMEQLANGDSDLHSLKVPLQDPQYRVEDELQREVDSLVANNSEVFLRNYIGDQIQLVMEGFGQVDDANSLRFAQRYMTNLNEALASGDNTGAIVAALSAKTVLDVEGYMSDSGDFEFDVEMPAEGEPQG